MKNINKKGQMGGLPMEEIGKWILILVGLALVIIGLYLMRNNISSIITKIGDFLRFGR
jgi:sulfite exporter TauE/SafE